MAVIVQYIVVRDGVQKMTFTTKKEADAYDKMLDIADNLYEFMETAELVEDEKLLEDLSFFIAQNKDQVVSILKGTNPPKKTSGETKKPAQEKSAEKPDQETRKEVPETSTDDKDARKKKIAKKK